MIKPDGVQRGYVRARRDADTPSARSVDDRSIRTPRRTFSRPARSASMRFIHLPQPSRRLTPAPLRLPPRRPPPRQVGEIIGRFEKKGNVLKGLKVFQTPKEVAEEHYQDLSEKPFFGDLVDYICSGPVVCMVWEGPGVVKSARKMIGATNPLESEPGTIRGDLAVEVGRNVIHGSDSVESAEREIALWFGGDDALTDWEPTVTPWVRE
jgi:nucleoside-diphosphate kinase